MKWSIVLFTLMTARIMNSASGSRSKSQPTKPPASDREAKKTPITEAMLINKLLNSKEYFKSEPPRRDHTTEVQIGIYVNTFYSINEQLMEYSLNFYLRQNWRDPRLEYAHMKLNITKIKLDSSKYRDIWVPDTFFRNEKKANTHEITVDNRLIRINATGHVWYVTKISATLTCNMQLSKYPMDVQECPILFESFGYTMDVMYFSWIEKPIQVDESVQLPQFNLKDQKLRDCSQSYVSGNYTCLEIRFVLERDFGFYLIQMYIPSILIVILSWISFWINSDASPARVSLGLLTVLTLTTQSTSIRSTLPRVSYIKAIDVWLSVCLVFTFASLIEYAIVNTSSRRTAPAGPPAAPIKSSFFRKGNKPKGQGNNVCHQVRIIESNSITAAPLPPPPRHEPPKPPEDGKAVAKRVDKFSRKAFPLAFLLFNIIYWLAYTVPSVESANFN